MATKSFYKPTLTQTPWVQLYFYFILFKGSWANRIVSFFGPGPLKHKPTPQCIVMSYLQMQDGSFQDMNPDQDP